MNPNNPSNKKMSEAQLELLNKELSQQLNSRFRTEHDVTQSVLTPQTKDNRGYQFEKVLVLGEDGIPLKDDDGKFIVRIVPKSIQLNRIQLMNSDDTTGVLRFKEEATDERLQIYLTKTYDFIESLYSFASQYKSINSIDNSDEFSEFWTQINAIALQYRNMAKYRLLLTKSRDGTMLGLTRTNTTVSQVIDKSIPQPLPNVGGKGKSFEINPNFEKEFTQGKSFF